MTRAEELDAAAEDLSRASARYKEALLNAVRVDPPEEVFTTQAAWSKWLVETFREGPRERTVTLAPDQLASLLGYCKSAEFITPFGTLRVTANLLPETVDA